MPLEVMIAVKALHALVTLEGSIHQRHLWRERWIPLTARRDVHLAITTFVVLLTLLLRKVASLSTIVCRRRRRRLLIVAEGLVMWRVDVRAVGRGGTCSSGLLAVTTRLWMLRVRGYRWVALIGG